MAVNQTETTSARKETLPAGDVGAPQHPEEDLSSIQDLYEEPRTVKPVRKTGAKLYSKSELLEKLPSGHFRLRVEKLRHEGPGLTIRRYFTKDGVHPYDEVEWEMRTAKITNDKGQVIFEQNDLEFPKSWTQLATNVVVSKYFRGKLGEPTREKSLKNLLDRVAKTIAQWGFNQGYFASEDDRDIFCEELIHLLLHQQGSFNSPVWFNVGQEEYPQCSACFINSVNDTMESILDLAKTEGMLFKYGSGTGTNLSSLRSSREHLSAGGVASGPVSFMKGYDAFAGVIKSGGKTRRAAKMVMLDVDHPDIMDFIQCKVREEKKAWALIDAGYDGNFDGEAYASVFFQNSNNSVRLSDVFMEKLKANDKWYTRAVTDKRRMDEYDAKYVMREIAEATHVCGDPGLQFHDTINKWNPVADTETINASNPCSEYMFVDDSACNLASLNLMTFLDDADEFDTESFEKAVDTFVLAQEILVDNAAYPRKPITWNSHLYRPLGLGYTNLGALLMSRGLPYDSDEGRAYAAGLTALMTGRAYHRSSVVAEHFEPFREFDKNRNSFLKVIDMHRKSVKTIDKSRIPDRLIKAAEKAWDDALTNGARHGFRNGQLTVLAPTGTISFMMDADTTGIEPDLALVKYKKLVGGGTFKIVNHSVEKALTKLGYTAEQREEILAFVEEQETVEGAPHMKEEHLPVFDTALVPMNGTRYIAHMGHIAMMAAVQPFISGAISKTVNMPEDCTVDDIAEAYTKAWEMGLKAIAIYRNNSKRTQPLNTRKKEKGVAAEGRPYRRKLPDERPSITHKFNIGGHEGYVTAGFYEDGAVGEIFIVMSKEGSSISGLLDGFATMTSLALQYGVPLEDLVSKFSHMRFEPAGMTNNAEVRIAKSIYDYIFRWLASKFLSPEKQQEIGNNIQPTITNGHADGEEAKPKAAPAVTLNSKAAAINQSDAPSCPSCGDIMTRSASCYVCLNCGTQHGCG